MVKNNKLDFLINEFKAESVQYKKIQVPVDIEGKRNILRSLMNVRMPKEMSEDTLKIQDEYLKERAKEKGIVKLEDISSIAVLYGVSSKYSDKLSIWQGDITRIEADAIVNAANSQMLGCFVPMHTCIDNCIHTFAGVQLREECNRNMNELKMKYGSDYEQPTAIPMLTDAYNLPAKKVIHVVGPIVYDTLTENEEKALKDCYINVLNMCYENGLRSVAFCCISTGVFHFPNDKAAKIAVDTVISWLKGHENDMDKIIFNVFKDEDKYLYEKYALQVRS